MGWALSGPNPLRRLDWRDLGLVTDARNRAAMR
jgi:hypothetical protein